METIKNFIKNKLHEQISSSRQSLWHATSLINAVEAIDNNFLAPHTSHRYWPDGIRRKENDHNYEKSFWMYGWSMTRKKEYAFNWNSIIFEFETEKISQNFKILPLSWNYLFKDSQKLIKKEFEEFVISHYEPKSIDDLKKEELNRDILFEQLQDKKYLTKNLEEKKKIQTEIDNLSELSWMKIWQTPKGKNLNLNKTLKDIYIQKNSYEIYLNDSHNQILFNKILNHPLYKGIVETEKNKNKKNTI